MLNISKKNKVKYIGVISKQQF